MPALTEKESEFISQRESLLRLWPYVGALLLAGIAAYIAWCWLNRPYLISPVAVFEGIQEGTMDRSTIETLAVLCAVSMIITWSLLAIGVGFAFAIFGTERRHIAIIRRLSSEAESSADNPPRNGSQS